MFLPVKSVGVMGDGRTYEWVVALRAVVTSDFMTAHWAELPYSPWAGLPTGLSTKCAGSTAWYDVSGNRRRRLSGSELASGIDWRQ